MTGGEQMTVMGALNVLGLIVVIVIVAHGLVALAWRCGWMDDPDGLPFEESPGFKTDRQRLIEEGEIR